MKENYEEVVLRWYNKLKPLFQNVLHSRYETLSSDTIDDLYQDAFLAVYNNIQSGSVKDQTSWNAYIIQIGLNLAAKKMRRVVKSDSLDAMFIYDEQTQSLRANRVDALLNDSFLSEISVYHDKDVLWVLGKELQYVPEPCATIIRLFYYDNMSMEDISAAVNLKNASTAKAKKSQCMKSFTTRVKESLHTLGIV